MKIRPLLASAAALAVCATPAAAQDADAPPPIVLSPIPDRDVDADADTEADIFNLDEDEALEQLRAEIEAEFGVLSEFFKVEPLSPEQEARLPLTEALTDRIFPKGTFGTVMKDAMGPLMNVAMSAATNDPRIRLAAVTGVDPAELEALSDEDAQEALDIFDPTYAGRTGKMGDMMVEMISRLFDAIEPAYRGALARALATRFDDAELREVLTQLDNPAIAKLAQQSFLVQYDPQMLSVMEQLGPAMMEVMPGMMEDFAEFEEEMADEGRIFIDLSAAERTRAARLLGKSESELEALAPVPEEVEEVTDASVI